MATSRAGRLLAAVLVVLSCLTPADQLTWTYRIRSRARWSWGFYSARPLPGTAQQGSPTGVAAGERE